MAKTERKKGDYIFVDGLDDAQIQEFIDDCVNAGAVDPPSISLCRDANTLQFDDDLCIEVWENPDTHEYVYNPRSVTHEYTQKPTKPLMSPQKKSKSFVCDIREMSLNGLSHKPELRQEFTAITDILFDDGKDWWDVSKNIADTTMIDTEKVMVIEMLFQVVHDTILEYSNGNALGNTTIVNEILDEYEPIIKHVAMHLPFSQESVLYDWWAEFKQRYTLPCEDNEEQAVLDMLSNVEGLTVELNKDGIILYDHALETEASVNTLSEAKDIIRAKQSYTKAFN